jgi:hypothetical protein
MNTLMLRKWKENGFIDALLDEKLQVYKNNDWKTIINDGFELDINSKYRIKPKFEVGDLVKTAGEIFTVFCVQDEYIHLTTKNGTIAVHQDVVWKVKKVLKPHTFETAVKDCAENGFELKGNNKITGLGMSYFYVCGIAQSYNDNYFHFPNDKPFCQVEYEEC